MNGEGEGEGEGEGAMIQGAALVPTRPPHVSAPFGILGWIWDGTMVFVGGRQNWSRHKLIVRTAGM